MLHGLRAADKAAGATGHRIKLAGLLVALAHRMAAADGADLREPIALRRCRTFFHHDIENLRNDIAGALDDHRVANPDIVPLLADTLTVIADALDIVGIVQRR